MGTKKNSATSGLKLNGGLILLNQKNFGGVYEQLIKMVKEKYAQCCNWQRFDTIADFKVAISHLEYIINNHPLFTQKDPVTQLLVVIRPSHFIHPGHLDQCDHQMTNLFSFYTEMNPLRLDCQKLCGTHTWRQR